MNVKQIYVLTIFLALFIRTNAQLCSIENGCITDQTCVLPDAGGFCPENIPEAILDEYYDTFITVVAPKTGEHGGITVNVNSIDIVNVEGLPEGLQWCKSTTKFKWNELGCLHVWGVPKTIGDYQLTIYVKATVLGSLTVDKTDKSLTMKVIKSKNPTVDFSAATTLGNVGDSILFTDHTDSSATAWFWTFEEGVPAISAMQHPVVQWKHPGYYSVSLLAKNSFGEKQIVKYNYMRISDSLGNLPAMAIVQAHKTVAVVQEEIYFENSCTDSLLSWIDPENNSIHHLFCYETTEKPYRWHWAFEKGTPAESDSPNPTVSWNLAGKYSVALLVVSKSGEDRFIIKNYMTINDILEYKIFPNPARNRVSIEALNMERVLFYNVFGQEVLSEPTHPTHHEIDISMLQSGVYAVTVIHRNGIRRTKKLVILR